MPALPYNAPESAPETGKDCKAGDTGLSPAFQHPPNLLLVQRRVNGLGQLMPHTGNGEISMECFLWTESCAGLLRDTSFPELERLFRHLGFAGTCADA